MRNFIYLFLPFFFLGFAACSTIPRVSPSPEEAAATVKHQQQRKQEALNHSLKEKADIIEQRLQAQFIDPETQLPHEYFRKGTQGPLHLELATTYLSALAYQYAVTKDETILNRIITVIQGIIIFDKINGYDGYLPTLIKKTKSHSEISHTDSMQAPEARVSVPEYTYTIQRNQTHINAYTQILYAYTLADQLTQSPKVHHLVQSHIQTIFAHLLKTNLVLYNQHGERMPYSDIKIAKSTWNPSDKVDGLVFTAVGVQYLPPNDPNYNKINTLKKKAHKQYRGIGPLVFDIDGFIIPTPGTTWLNLLALDTLQRTDPSEVNRERIIKLSSYYDEEQNPIFDLMRAKYDNENTEKLLQRVHERLAQYPLTLDAAPMPNSHRTDIPIDTETYIKFRAHPQTTPPLPLYEIASNNYLWKRNLKKLDTGHNSEYQYTGIDYLEAYWFLRWLESSDT